MGHSHFFALLIFLLTQSGALASSPHETVEKMIDPFHIGALFESDFYDTDTPDSTNRTVALHYLYGWTNGVAVDFILPISLWNDPASFADATTPRIGGSPHDRIEFDTSFRFWGDSSNYFGWSFGVGLPFQSDGALDGREYNTWYIPLSVIFRITPNSLFALRGTVTDSWMSPVSTSGALNEQTYVDYTNSIGLTFFLSLFPKGTVSPYFKWSDTWPIEKDTGVDTGSSSFLQKETPGAETRILSVGVDFIPFSKSLLFTLECDTKIFPYAVYPQTYYGRFRWAF